MIQTFALIGDRSVIVQAVHFTGTLSSAHKVCRWLNVSRWNGYVRGGSYRVSLPTLLGCPENTVATEGDWIVKASHAAAPTVMTNADFTSTYERV